MSRPAHDDAPPPVGDVPGRVASLVGRRLEVSPERALLIAKIAFAALVGIVLSGALVRVSGSGLGCPNWPRCDTRVTPTELGAPVAIEFGNRLLTFLVSASSLGALLAGLARRPYRRSLVVLPLVLVAGVALQAVIGGISVLVDLDWQVVALHYLVSAAMLVPAAMLVWRAGLDTPAPPRSPQAGDRLVGRVVSALLPLGLLTLLLGTLSTAAGPHSGGTGTGDVVQRLDVRGQATLQWIVERHGVVAAIFGVAVVVAWLLAGSRGSSRRLTGALALSGMLVGAQGLVGLLQYGLELPGELVWVHVALATLTWAAIVWSWQLAGGPGAELRGDALGAGGTEEGEAAPAELRATARVSALSEHGVTGSGSARAADAIDTLASSHIAGRDGGWR